MDQIDDSPSVRRVDGPTPNGGAYMVIAEYTQNGERRAEITEYDDSDNEVFRTYGKIVPKADA